MHLHGARGMRGEVADLTVRVYRDLDDLQTLVPAWNELLSVYAPATTFCSWEWLSSWWRAFGGARELLVLAFYHRSPNSDGELIGLAPLSVERHGIAGPISLKKVRLMGDGSGDSDNLDMPVRPGWEEQFAVALSRYLNEQKGLWDFCELNTLPPDSPGAESFRRYLKAQGWSVLQYQRVASAISLPDNWEEYLHQLSSEDQKNLSRYARRLEKRYQTRIYRCTQESELPAILEALFQLHQERWQAAGEAGSFASEERRRFYHDLSRLLLTQSKLELWVLELNGRIAAVQYAFRYGKTVFQLQEGFDPERSSDRVGFVLRGHVMKQLIEEGVKKYDFLAGEPGYKARWSVQVAHYVNCHFAPPFSLGNGYLSAIHKARAGKEWLRSCLPPSLWNGLRWINTGLRKKDHRRPGNAP
jgi:CelD/BcsL family acetyltransferase involved in cellulose biosynthesis